MITISGKICDKDLAYITERYGEPSFAVPCPKNEKGVFNPTASSFLYKGGVRRQVFSSVVTYYRHKNKTWRPLLEIAESVSSFYIVFKEGWENKVDTDYFNWLVKRQKDLGGTLLLPTFKDFVFNGYIYTSTMKEYTSQMPEYMKAYCTTTTFKPDAYPQTNCFDAGAGRFATENTFSNLVTSAGSSHSDITDASDISYPLLRGGASTDKWAGQRRYECLFDTSSLTSSAVISAATLSPHSAGPTNAGDFYSLSVNVYTSGPASNSANADNDYDVARWGSTALSDTAVTVTSFIASAHFVDYAFNSTGISAISLTGVSKFGTRFTNDAANSAPTWASGGNDAAVVVSVRNSGTTNSVKLVVTYTISLPAQTISVSDSITVSESVTMSVNRTLNVSDSLTVTDVPTVQYGPIYFDASSASVYEASLSTYNWTHVVGVGTNGILVIGVAIFAAGTVSSITAGTKNAVFLRADANGVYRSELWYVVNPDVGSQTITVNLSTSLTSIAGAASYFRVDQSTPFEGSTGANGIGGSDTVNVTTTFDADWIIDVTSTLTNPISVGTGQTQRINVAGSLGSIGIGDRKAVAPPAVKAANWSGTGITDPWSITAAAMIPDIDIIEPSVSDSINVSENVTMQVTRTLNVSDSITISESVGIGFVSTLSTSDSVTITENVAISNPLTGVNVSDTLTITDSVTLNNPQLGGISVFDTITISENYGEIEILFISVIETITISESTTLFNQLFISVLDSITLTESLNEFVANNVTVSDSITLTESKTLLETSFVSVSDSITISENYGELDILNLTTFDLINISENIQMGQQSYLSVSDSITITETDSAESFRFSPSIRHPIGEMSASIRPVGKIQ